MDNKAYYTDDIDIENGNRCLTDRPLYVNGGVFLEVDVPAAMRKGREDFILMHPCRGELSVAFGGRNGV